MMFLFHFHIVLLAMITIKLTLFISHLLWIPLHCWEGYLVQVFKSIERRRSRWQGVVVTNGETSTHTSAVYGARVSRRALRTSVGGVGATSALGNVWKCFPTTGFATITEFVVKSSDWFLRTGWTRETFRLITTESKRKIVASQPNLDNTWLAKSNTLRISQICTSQIMLSRLAGNLSRWASTLGTFRRSESCR